MVPWFVGYKIKTIDEEYNPNFISPNLVDTVSIVSIIISSKWSYDSISISFGLFSKDKLTSIAIVVAISHWI